jgi:hypothetical protein
MRHRNVAALDVAAAWIRIAAAATEARSASPGRASFSPASLHAASPPAARHRCHAPPAPGGAFTHSCPSVLSFPGGRHHALSPSRSTAAPAPPPPLPPSAAPPPPPPPGDRLVPPEGCRRRRGPAGRRLLEVVVVLVGVDSGARLNPKRWARNNVRRDGNSGRRGSPGPKN